MYIFFSNFIVAGHTEINDAKVNVSLIQQNHTKNKKANQHRFGLILIE